MESLIREYWHAIGAMVAGIAWLVRLEGRVGANAAGLQELRRQRVEDLETAKDSRAEVHRMLDEIRADIKELLRNQKDAK